jgi:hypothetical protein
VSAGKTEAAKLSGVTSGSNWDSMSPRIGRAGNCLRTITSCARNRVDGTILVPLVHPREGDAVAAQISAGQRAVHPRERRG